MRPFALLMMTVFLGFNAFADKTCIEKNISREISTKALVELCPINTPAEARLVYRFCTEIRGGTSELCSQLSGHEAGTGQVGGTPSTPVPVNNGRSSRKPGQPSEAFCEQNPYRIGCEKSEAYCEQNPSRIGCEKSEAYCRNNPSRIGCEHSEAYCEQNPNRIGCEKSEAYCRDNPNRIGCEHSEAYCEQNPYRIGCEKSEAYCRLNPHSIACSGD